MTSPESGPLKPGERVDNLLDEGLKIIQHDDFLKFSLDAILLARFVTLKGSERVADLGTGGGVIPLILVGKRHMRHVAAFEIQAEAADMAKRSVLLNGLADRISVGNIDLRDLPREFWDSFEVVVSNPPYLKASDGQSSPKPSISIAKQEVACTLEDVLRAAARLLRPLGRAAFVYRPHRLPELLAEMLRFHLAPARMRTVHSFEHDPAILVLVEAIHQGRAGLEVLPPLVVHTADGAFTQEMVEIYGRSVEQAVE